jgi:hypothetical protein
MFLTSSKQSFATYLAESAGFSSKKVEAAIDLIISYLGNKIGSIEKMPGIEEYVKADGEKGFGLRYFTGKKSFRFNWIRKGNYTSVHSVDIWDGSTFYPNYNIDTEGLSLVKILPKLVTLIKHPKIGKHSLTESSEVAFLLMEAKKTFDEIYDEIVEWLDERGDDPFLGSDIARLSGGTRGLQVVFQMIRTYKNKFKVEPKGKRTYYTFKGTTSSLDKDTVLAELGGKEGKDSPSKKDEKLEVKPGQKEKITSAEIKKIEAEEREKNRIPYEQQLADLKELVTGVVKKGISNAIFLTGKPGTSKTYTVEKTLKELGLEDGHGMAKITTTSSPSAMYRSLFDYKDTIILFDDADSALDDVEGRNIIKSATDTKKVRKLMWPKTVGWTFDPDRPPKDEEDEDAWYEKKIGEGFYPKYFYFTGKVVFISNLPVKKLDPDGALKSRAFVLDIDPTRDELAAFMKKICGEIELEGGLTLALPEREEVVDVVIHDEKNQSEFSIRKLVRGLNMRAAGLTNWKELVVRYA